jgi:DHA1 family tetracycline resistance protein-like MFS transporter
MQADAASPPVGSKAALLLVLVVVFINMAGFSLILPLLPFYGHEFEASPVEITMLFAAYSFGNIFGEIWWGRASDRYGRKRVLMLTIGAAALSYVVFAFASTLWLALSIRIVTGFFSGTLGVCQSYVADVTRPEERPKSMGYFGAALNLGFVIGPAIGGLLARPELGLAGFRLPIFTAAAFCGVSALWTALVLRDTRTAGANRPSPAFGDAFRFVAGHALLRRLLALAFIGIGTFASMEAVFGLWTQHHFGWSAREVGLTFIAVGATGLLVQLLLIGPLSRRYGEARVIVLGLVVLGVSMVLQPILKNPVAAVVLMSMLMAGHSLAFPNVGSLISRSTPPQNQGSVLGLQMASTAFSRIVVPPFFGFIYAAFSPDAPYFACSLVMLGAIFIAVQAVSIREAALRKQQAAAV